MSLPDVDLTGAVFVGILFAAFWLQAPVEKWLWTQCVDVAAVEQCGPSPFISAIDQPLSPSEES